MEAPPKAPLTEEEKKEKLAKLEELRVKKRFENRFSPVVSSYALLSLVL